MNFSRYMNTQFNLFHAVAWSMGFHIIVIAFSPSLKNEAPIKFEKQSEKIRLKIAKKPEKKNIKTHSVNHVACCGTT